jgi:hypothetical protein
MLIKKEKRGDEVVEIHESTLEDFAKECSEMVGIMNEKGEEEKFPPIEKDN